MDFLLSTLTLRLVRGFRIGNMGKIFRKIFRNLNINFHLSKFHLATHILKTSGVLHSFTTLGSLKFSWPQKDQHTNKCNFFHKNTTPVPVRVPVRVPLRRARFATFDDFQRQLTSQETKVYDVKLFSIPLLDFGCIDETQEGNGTYPFWN